MADRSIMSYETVALDEENHALVIIDQTKLPGQVKMLHLTEQKDIWQAIYLLQVRGAPAIGVAAGFGLYLAARRIQADGFEDFYRQLHEAKEYLNSSRPTAVNLSWALNRMEQVALNHREKPVAEIQELLRRECITIKEEGNQLILERPSDDKNHRALHGLYRALVHNMVVGVTDGFAKTLEMVGTGYRAQAEGKKLTINIGFSHPVILEAPENITFETPAPTKIVIKGINKQQVGNLAADIRAIRKPEPYLGKGIKYENEHIRRKEGKAGK